MGFSEFSASSSRRSPIDWGSRGGANKKLTGQTGSSLSNLVNLADWWDVCLDQLVARGVSVYSLSARGPHLRADVARRRVVDRGLVGVVSGRLFAAGGGVILWDMGRGGGFSGKSDVAEKLPISLGFFTGRQSAGRCRSSGWEAPRKLMRFSGVASSGCLRDRIHLHHRATR